MIAQSPIPVFLDTVRVRWFNTLANINKEAIIPARRINVGLPDRADLLVDIALQDNLWDRFTFEMISSDIHKMPWRVSFVLLLLICSALGIREVILRRRESKQFSDGQETGSLPKL
ncbi:MAG: hypothetical protein ACJA0Z_001966 [Halioglobus sp.]|jgi:hypothetical protein